MKEECEIESQEYEERFISQLASRGVYDAKQEYRNWMEATEPEAKVGIGDPEQDANECFDYYDG